MWRTLGLLKNSFYKRCVEDPLVSMKGKVVLITGATRGIGRSGAIRLAGLGARLILVGRHRGRLEEVARLCREAGAPEVTLYVVDLSQRKEVMDLVEKLITRGGKLDVLWNNAGGYFTERRVTKEGLERTWALNHIAYVDLTQGLFPLLEKSEYPRVICTASEAHRMGVLRWDNLQGERSWNGWKAYCLTKLANILYVAEQGRRLEESKIRICAVHPGLVNSALGDENQGFSGVAFRLLKLFFGKTNEEGADTAVWLASRTTRPTQGAYYAYRKERIPKASAQSLESSQRLWKISQRA